MVLALDSATPRVSIAIGDDGRVVAELQHAGSRRHAELLAPDHPKANGNLDYWEHHREPMVHPHPSLL
jgi:hypothetical protein